MKSDWSSRGREGLWYSRQIDGMELIADCREIVGALFCHLQVRASRGAQSLDVEVRGLIYVLERFSEQGETISQAALLARLRNLVIEVAFFLSRIIASVFL